MSGTVKDAVSNISINNSVEYSDPAEELMERTLNSNEKAICIDTLIEYLQSSKQSIISDNKYGNCIGTMMGILGYDICEIAICKNKITFLLCTLLNYFLTRLDSSRS